MMTAVQEQYQTRQSGREHAVIASLNKASKNFGDVHALREIDFAVKAGELVAMLGPNGAGKTTAVKLFSDWRSRAPTAASMYLAEIQSIPKFVCALGPCSRSPKYRKRCG